MKLKIIYNYIYFFFFISFFFFWDINLFSLKNYDIFGIGKIKYLEITLNFLILILLLPIFYLYFSKRNNLDLFKILKEQINILYLCLFVLIHAILISFFYNKHIVLEDYLTIFFIFALGIIYCKYRNFLFINFDKIIIIFIIILFIFSLFSQSRFYNTGSCFADFYLISFFKKSLNLNLSNVFYKENSHLAMTIVGVLISITFFASTKKNNYLNIFFLILTLFLFIFILLNSSSTFFISYFVSQLIILIFFYKKISYYFFFYSFILLIISIFAFNSDSNCTKKISDFNVNDIVKKNITKEGKNLTTLIYERSFIVAIDTLVNRPFGWGVNGTEIATVNLLNMPEYINIYIGAKNLNLKDGLGNFFKIINEFGVFSFIIFFMFIRYLLHLKKISAYNLFIVALFITQCIRGAGFFNGGFIFCIFEFFYINTSSKQLNKNLKKS